MQGRRVVCVASAQCSRVLSPSKGHRDPSSNANVNLASDRQVILDRTLSSLSTWLLRGPGGSAETCST